MKQGTQSRCSGTTQRDGMRREMGGSSGWGDTCAPWLIHVDGWPKPPQYCKGISLQLKLINYFFKERKCKKKKKLTFSCFTPDSLRNFGDGAQQSVFKKLHPRPSSTPGDFEACSNLRITDPETWIPGQVRKRRSGGRFHLVNLHIRWVYEMMRETTELWSRKFRLGRPKWEGHEAASRSKWCLQQATPWSCKEKTVSLAGSLGDFSSGVGPDLSRRSCWLISCRGTISGETEGWHVGSHPVTQTLWWKGSWNISTAELPSQAHVWSRLSLGISLSVQRKASPWGFSHCKGQEMTWFWWGLAFLPAFPPSVGSASSIQSEFHELCIPAPFPLHSHALSFPTQCMIF